MPIDVSFNLQLIAAYQRGYEDGYKIGTKEWSDYERDMESMKDAT